MNKAKQLAAWIGQSKYTVFFGGAGVSTESGIPDFRSKSGLYAAELNYGYPPEELLSHHLFVNKPALFFRYYKENLIALNAKPNVAHKELAGLEAKGLLQVVITQNIDGLHQKAGSSRVLELHGSSWRQYCINCKTEYSLEYILSPENCREEVIPICGKCGGIVRPDVVLYEEGLKDAVVSAAIQAIASAELLIVGGTSLAVYPAAGLLRYFCGEHLALINQTETAYDRFAQLVIHGEIGKVMDEVMKGLKGSISR